MIKLVNKNKNIAPVDSAANNLIQFEKERPAKKKFRR